MGDRKLLHARRFSSMLAHSGAQGCLLVCLLLLERVGGRKPPGKNKFCSSCCSDQTYFPSSHSVHHIHVLYNSWLAFCFIPAFFLRVFVQILHLQKRASAKLVLSHTHTHTHSLWCCLFTAISSSYCISGSY